MGKTVTSVGTQADRVVDDDLLPNSVQTGVTTALFKEQDLVESILDELNANVGMRAERLYAYAAKGNYTYGLPSGQYTKPASQVADAVQTTLLAIEGQPVVVDYLQWGAPNNLHIGWLQLMDAHGYDPATNKLGALSAAKGTAVYLHDMVSVIPASQADSTNAYTLEAWGIAAKAGYTPERTSGTEATRAMVQATPAELDATASAEYLRVEYVWEANGALQRGSFTMAVDGYDDQQNYFQVRYTVGGLAKYWIYLDGAGTYPVLDTVYDRLPEQGGTYFPFIYFRYDKTAQNADTSTEAYKTGKKMASYLGMDFDEVCDAMHENPDIADVEQAMVMFAVPANTENPVERHYLWEYFNNLYLSQAETDRTTSEESAGLSRVAETLLGLGAYFPDVIIQDTRFKMALRNRGIYKRLVAGSIGEVGEFDSGYTSGASQMTVTNAQTGLDEVITTPLKYHYFRKQISKTYYAEIQVADLKTQFFIWNGYSAIGDDEDDILLVPLDHSITEHFAVTEREELYARSLHYIYNSRVTTKLKWYQSGWFKLVMIVVAVVIVIYSWGTQTQTAVALLQAGAYSAAAMVILQVVVQLVVMQFVFKLAVKAVGAEAAFAIALLAAAAGAAQAVDAGSVAGAPFASELLMVSSGLANAVSKQLQADMRALQGQQELIADAQEELLEELEEAKDLLSQQVILNPFVIFGEKPDDYYKRTVHSGNVGVLGITAIEHYVDTQLKLPTLSDSFGYLGGIDEF